MGSVNGGRIRQWTTTMALFLGVVAWNDSWGPSELVCSAYGNDESPLQVTKKVHPGEDSPPSKSEQGRAVAELIQQLGSSSFLQRRTAYQQLLKKGAAALAEVELAAGSENRQIAESAMRLRTLLRVMSKCQDGQLAAEIADLFLEANEENLVNLAERGLWDLAELFLDEHPALAIRCQQIYFQDFHSQAVIGRLVDLAEKQGNARLAWPLVSRLAPAELVYWTANRLDLPVLNEPEDIDDRAKQMFFSGKIDQALELEISASLKFYMALRGFRWQHFRDPQLQRFIATGQENAGNSAAQAVLLEYAGDSEAGLEVWQQLLGLDRQEMSSADRVSAAALEQLEQLAPIVASTELEGPSKASTKPAAFYQMAVALMLAGFPDAVNEYSRKEFPEAAFSSTLRIGYGQAFELIGLKADLSNFESWMEDQIVRSRQGIRSYEQQPVSETQQMVTAINLGHMGAILAGLGHQSEAKKILLHLITQARTFRGEADVWNRCILRWIGSDRWRELCIETIAEVFDVVPGDQMSLALEKLFPSLGVNASGFLAESPAIIDSPTARAQALRQMEHLQRCDKEFFGPEYQTVIRSWLLRVAKRQTSRRERNIEDSEASYADGIQRLALAKLAAEWEDSTTAFQLLGLGGSEPFYDFDALIEAAKQCLKAKEASTALDLIDLAAPGPSQHHWRSAIRLDALLASGKFQQAADEYSARWLRMNSISWNGDRSLGYRVVDDLIQEQRWEEAAEYAERNFIIDTAMDRTMLYYSFWQVRQFATILEELEQYQRSADILRAAQVDLLRPASSVVRYLAMVGDLDLIRVTASRERVSRAVACIQQQKYDQAKHHLDIAFRLNSQDVEPVVSCYPLLVQAGKTELATQLFDQVNQGLEAHLAQWPQDAMSLNNLAWMYAKCQVRLDQALELSQLAVSLVPTSAVYRDTLAEVQFQRGEIDAAIGTMRDCVKIDPRGAGYRKNLVRFNNARR